jgi:5-methylcytosine-specific restriction endonuclease McrA
MRAVAWMQRSLIRQLCKLPAGQVVDVAWLQAVWKFADPKWVTRFWGQVNNGPRGKAIRSIAAAPVAMKQELKRLSRQHFQFELRYTGRILGRIDVFDWDSSDVYKHFKLLMTSFYEEWLLGESIPTPKGQVSVKSLYATGLATALVCPYCDRQLDDNNRRIDHFFPDSKFPTLSVSLSNLIPVCETCNGLSGKHKNLPCSPTATDSVADWFHPHFRSADRKVTVSLSGVRPNLVMHLTAVDPADQARVDSFVTCVKLNWADNPERDVNSFKRHIVVDLQETPASPDMIIAALNKWSTEYNKWRGEGPEAIKKHGCFKSMATMPAIIAEIEAQLIEDQRLSTPPSNGYKRKA